jgi:hypothetical protein
MGTWEQQRDRDLEPVTQDLEAAKPKQGRGDELAKRNERSVDAILRSAPTMKADTQQSSNEVTALLAKHPTKTRGPDGYAAWLLEADRLGFVDAHTQVMTAAQLHNLLDEKTPVRTWEYNQDDDVDENAEKNRKKATNGQLDNANRVPAEKNKKPWRPSPVADRGYKPNEWDIKLAETPILGPLVEVARARIQTWLTKGGPKTALSLGDFVRADMWYDTHEKAPPHEPGTAMDLGFAGRGARDTEVLELLHDLPARGGLTVFLDNDGALHLDVRPDGYGLGIPSGGEFIPRDIVIEHDDHGVPTQKAEQAAGDNHGGTLHATGVKRFSGVISNGVATWGVVDAKTKREGWKWTWTQTTESMLKYMSNQKLLAAINAYKSKH